MKAQLASARLPGRKDERVAAEAQVAASKAALEQSEIRLAQKSQLTPADGLVQDIFYRTGEWVAPGQAVQVRCDGCPAPLPATIRFISPSAEYTPPVLYSEKNRHRLVYMVEAWPRAEDAAKLHPGQPVDVSLKPAQASK